MFSILKNFINPEKVNQKSYSEIKSAKTSDLSLLEFFGAGITRSGTSVSGEKALNVPAVLQAVRLISENIGSLPCKLYRDTSNGKEADKSHTAYRIAHRFASGWASAGKLRADLTKDALIYGHGFARVVRYSDGRPFELRYLCPHDVTILEDDQTGEPVYRVSNSSGSIDYHYTDILHIRSFADRSPVSFGREAIGLSSMLETHAAHLFGSGARPASVIVFDSNLPVGEVGETTIRRFKDSYQKAAQNGFKSPLILDRPVTYQQMALASTDAQFLENRVFQIDDIARIFGVPPSMLYQLDRATWSNAEQMAATFLQLCLRPWLDRWQDAYATVLLTEDEQDDHYFEFVIDDLQRTDAAARAEIFSKLIASRVLTPNEARAAMNLSAMEGGDQLANPFTTSSTDAAVTSDISKDISNDQSNHRAD